MSVEPVKSTRRERQAAATRREILEAARHLFAQRGYAGTAIADIADAAGVAVQTIYSSVGTKHAVLGALLDHLDEEAGVAEHWARLRATDDPREAIRIGVQLTRAFQERCGDLVLALHSAAPIEPEMAEALAGGRARHRNGTKRWVERIARTHGLRKGMSARRGGDVFAVLTSTETWQQLHAGHGWSWDEIEDWLTATLCDLLLAP
jgi:AcrR family transcriptional regulator